MGGKVLEYETKTIWKQGFEHSIEEITKKHIRQGKMTDKEISETTGLSETRVTELRNM